MMLSGSPVELAELNIGQSVEIDGTLFFAASDGNTGTELWKSDGTEAGTVLVKDIDGGADSSFPAELTNVDGMLFFAASDETNGTELWKSDGTEAGTVLVKDIKSGGGSSYLRDLTNVNGTLFFNAEGDLNGGELWKSDGTEAGTVLVKDINSGRDGSYPTELENVDGTLLFAASNGYYNSGLELWKSDGTEAGTVLVKDINSGSNPSYPYELTNVDGTLFFVAEESINGGELWKSDGTEAGTVLVKDINSGGNGSYPINLTSVDGTLFFSVADAISGRELWKSDGTEAGTVLVKDINVGSGSSYPSELTNGNGTLFFSVADGINGRELWKSDGTEAGTVLVKDINSGSDGSYPISLTAANGTLFFSAADVINGRELWKSDGTEVGTVLVSEDLNSVNDLAFTGSNLFFEADRTDDVATLQVIRGDYQSFAAPYGFEDISETGESILAGVDNGSETLTSDDLGAFTFEFYGETHDELHINLNGLITFDAPFTSANNDFNNLDDPAIAVFWDSLSNEGGNGSGSIFWEVRGRGDDHRLIVQWEETSFGESSTNLLTFQAVLYKNGKIRLNYQDVLGGSQTQDNGKSATIGVKQRSGQFSEANVVHENEISGLIGRLKSVIIDQSTLADAHGYRTRVERFSFNDISETGTEILDGADDAFEELGQAEIPGFNFEFYGVTYDSLFVSTNGLITFGEGNGSPDNSDFSTNVDQPAIAVLWDEHINDFDGGGIFYELVGAEGFQELTIQYRVSLIEPVLDQTFQVVLSEADNSIRVHYQDLENDVETLDNAANATIGIKDAGNDRSRMQLYSFNDNLMVESGSSIRFVDDNVFAIRAGSGNDSTLIDVKNEHVEIDNNGNLFFVYDGTNDIRIFDTGGTTDEFLIDGTQFDEEAITQAGLTTFTSLERTVNVHSYEATNLDMNLGLDIVKVFGTVADDTVTFRESSTELRSADQFLFVRYSEDVNVIGEGGNDSAEFFGTEADEKFIGNINSSLFVSDIFRNRATGFNATVANAGTGNDIANVVDTPGNDTFTGNPDEATIEDSDGTYSVRSVGFDRVIARAINGGNEQAFFTGSSEGDRFTGRETFGLLKSLSDDYLLRAIGFNRVVAEGNGGDDIANLFDSAGDDTFRGEQEKSFLKGTGFFNTVKEFGRVNAKASDGDDTATLIDSAGDDTFLGQGQKGILKGEDDSFVNFTLGFDTVRGDAANGGTDSLNVKPNITYTFVELGDWEN